MCRALTGWFKAISLALFLPILIAVLPLFVASAFDVPPTVRDYNMGNLAGNERELSIVVDPNDPDTLAAGANERGVPGGTQRWYVSTDGGRNWTNGRLPSGTLTVPGVASPTMSDPSLDFGSNGEIYYAALMHGGSTDPCTLFVSVSQNLGGVWSDPSNGVVAAGGTSPLICNDKEHILVDRLNNDNVYVAWTPVGGANDQLVVFSRDLNGVSDGLSFSAPVVLSTTPALSGCLNQGADFAMDGSGTLYVAWTSFCSGFSNGDPGTVYVVRSTNQGGMWSAPVAAATLDNANPAVAIGFRSRSHPSIDVDPTSGRVFVVYATNADTVGDTDPDIMIVSSPDGSSGSWTAPIRVNQDAGTTEQVLPWIDVGNGRVHVVFSSRANDGSNWNTHVAYAPVSASPTFTEVTVSSAPTPAATGFIGDYHGTFAGSDDVLHPAWGDGRTGVGGSTDAFTARLNFSPPAGLSLSPLSPTQNVGLNLTFVATVTGAHGEPETFIPVAFSVTSAGSPSSSGASGVSDASGQMSFTYTNTVPGTDDLHVFADLDEDGVEDPGEAVDTSVTWNGPPVADADGPYTVPEGSSVGLDGTGSTDPNGDPLTFEWDLDADGTFETPGPTPTFSAAGRDGPGSQSVTLRVCDPFGLCDTDTSTVTITNVPPTPDAGPDQTVYRFDPVSLSGTWADPAGSLDDPYAWSWDLDGDGSVDASGSASFGTSVSQTTSFALEGFYTLTFEVTDKDGGVGSDDLVVEVLNRPPDCSAAGPSIGILWPPDHTFVSVVVLGVTDPEGDPITITVDSIFQDEPVDTFGDGSFTPDGQGVGASVAQLRAERAGSKKVSGNGRVYHVTFTADDGHGGSCAGEVQVGVPKDMGKGKTPVDDGALYDSTTP